MVLGLVTVAEVAQLEVAGNCCYTATRNLLPVATQKDFYMPTNCDCATVIVVVPPCIADFAVPPCIADFPVPPCILDFAVPACNFDFAVPPCSTVVVDCLPSV